MAEVTETSTDQLILELKSRFTGFVFLGVVDGLCENMTDDYVFSKHGNAATVIGLVEQLGGISDGLKQKCRSAWHDRNEVSNGTDTHD